MKNLGKSFLYILGITLVMVILITLLNYINILNTDITNVSKILTPFIGTFISSYILGKNSKNKGYIEGLKLGGLFVLLLIIINLIISTPFSYTILLYYLIILVTSMLGSMIGINRKKDK